MKNRYDVNVCVSSNLEEEEAEAGGVELEHAVALES